MIKNLPFSSGLRLLLLALLAGDCTRDFEAVNTNPNAPESVPGTTLLLSGITNGMLKACSYHEFYAGGSLPTPSSLWCQHYAMAFYSNVDQYSVGAFDFIVEWPGVYSYALQDLQTLIDNPGNGPNLRAAGMVMRAWLFSVQTDLYGDIPYAQALDVKQFVQPAYDSQESIYKDLTRQLALAAGMLSGTGGAIGAGDVLYGGDWMNWKKFANSLRARLLNRYKHLDPQAKQDLEALLNDPGAFPVFESREDNAVLAPSGELPYVSQLYQVLTQNASGAIPLFVCSATMVDLLKTLGDPRLPVYAQPTTTGDYRGQKNGNNLSVSTDSVSLIGPVFAGNAQLPVPAMTYPEFLFVKAEALHDKQAYLDGITAAMDQYGLAPDSAYRAAAGSAWDANPLEALITQKWIALFLNGNEAYTELRRTGYPSTIHEALNSTHPGMGIPRRYVYPPIETTTNGANLQAAQTRQHIVGGQEMYGDKMWWAK